MPYIRKTKDVFVVQGNYGYGWNDLTYESSLKEAREQKRAYEDNENYPHRIIKRREKIHE